jgi:hypothetical protein
MKIGLSYSRCVRDIVDGTVDIADVLLIIARTDFDPHDDEQWSSIWQNYGGGHTLGGTFSVPEWMNYPAKDEDRFRSVSIMLYDDGKLHQPRKFGAHPRRMPYYWLETALPNNELDRFPAVKLAWDQFQTMAGLAGVKLDKAAQ